MKRERAAFVCHHVFEGSHPILLAAHEDGDWQFLCGAAHEPGDGPRVVGLNHLVERDPSIAEVLDLQQDWEAERLDESGPWVRRPIG
ncbi:hypothetical protein POL68_17965 [Stigmatella sp. ncwal1]|uniref:Uncharacterized protein n=1 Tax=Stigmatella ashevillensis TaxID=2995309 RepID=A0ABT5DB69_9BACT|nr:hypothetical protein [Stigmatella ashevillena]MDC0710368.1 hypothetical protein [Stigmatella ashevillena]